MAFTFRVGMDKDSNDFAGELFDALSRRRNYKGYLINKAQMKEFWDLIVDESFDSRLQTFFDMYELTKNVNNYSYFIFYCITMRCTFHIHHDS